MIHRFVSTGAVALLLLSSAGSAVAAGLYWTAQSGSNTVQVGSTDGSVPVGAVYTRTPGGANGIEAIGGRLYFPDQVAGVITRIDADGSGAVDLVTGVNPYDVDVEGGYLYWAEQNSNAIRRIQADGAGLASLVFSPANPVALDVTAANIFYAEFQNRLLRRAGLDGAGAVTLVSGQEIRDIEVIDDFVYFVGYNPRTFANAIQRVNTDGTGLVTLLGGLGLGNGIDVTADAIYYSDFFGPIGSVGLDGSNQTSLYAGPFGGTRGVAVLDAAAVPLPGAAWLMLAAAAGVAPRLRVRRHA